MLRKEEQKIGAAGSGRTRKNYSSGVDKKNMDNAIKKYNAKVIRNRKKNNKPPSQTAFAKSNQLVRSTFSAHLLNITNNKEKEGPPLYKVGTNTENHVGIRNSSHYSGPQTPGPKLC